MKTLFHPHKGEWESLCRRPLLDRSGLDEIVGSILKRVRDEGDKALVELTVKFDGIVTENLRVPASALTASAEKIPETLKKSIGIAIENIDKFHRAQLTDELPVETTKGVRCWRKCIPFETAGIYVPGGSAPLFSTVLMLAIPARIAGCRRIILCTPPDKDGSVNPLVLYAAYSAGVTDIFTVGGAQAIAAMAYGTESIPKADKIFGPGNQYVTRAKEMVQLDGIPIDIPAGPSEVLVIADSHADPSFVASDLLSQAEHGTDSQVILLTDSSDIIESVKDEVNRQIILLPRYKIASKSLENSSLILLDSLDECIELSNLYAPEHLIISTSYPMVLAEKVTNAGSVFLGKYSCESAGDYASGTNHTLPTYGYARNFSGVSTESFIKRITFQEVSPEGLRNLGPVIEQMAEAELLQGHKNAVAIRLKSMNND